MNQAEILELLARGAAVGAFLGIALLCARAGAMRPARLTAILFCLAAAGHTLTQMPGTDTVLGWALAPVWAFSAMGAGLFWAFVVELFEDRPKLEPIRFAPAGLVLAGALGASFTSGAVSDGFQVVRNLINAGLIAHALLVIAGGWRGDLVEARRRLRGPILVVAAIYALAIILVETAELFVGSAAALSPLGAVALMVMGLAGLAAFGRLDLDLFGATKASEPAEPSRLSPADAATAAALDRLMREERLYREEGLTISSLALKLKTPEHRLRRLINQSLGQRNFSAFLNQWRLADAKGALADPTQAGVPISTIAFDAGFASLGPFNRAFKAETGLTPSEFRAKAYAPAGASGLEGPNAPA